MHGLQHSGPGDERTQDGEGECGTQQRQVPDPEHPLPLLDHHRVQVGGPGQPGQERGVLHRIPRPVATPAQHVVGPPGPEDDAHRQATPGDQRPPTSLQQPALPEATSGQGGHRQGEGHGEPDVTQIEHRWVERHEHVVLEQWVGARPVVADPRLEPAEWLRWAGQQEEEEGADREHDQQGPTDHRIAQSVPEPAHDQDQIAHENQHPKQNRSLEGRPQGGHVEQCRGPMAAVLGHKGHSEVPGDQRPFHDYHLAHCGHGQNPSPGS